MNERTIVEVVCRLVGNTDPVGDTARDAEAYRNTAMLIRVTDRLICTLQGIRNRNANASEGSVSDVGNLAGDYLSGNERSGFR